LSSPELADGDAEPAQVREEIRFATPTSRSSCTARRGPVAHIPNDVLRELHGFIHMFEDTPEFVARYIMREAKATSTLAPPFFRALTHYAQTVRTRGTAPGTRAAWRSSRARSARCSTSSSARTCCAPTCATRWMNWASCSTTPGPVARASATRRASSMPTTCSSSPTAPRPANKIVWHSTVAPGDVVVVDRNCHKSILHAITMTGAVPVFLTPTRNHYGIIGPIPLEEFQIETIRKKIEANPLVRGKNKKPRILTITQSTYDGISTTSRRIKQMLDGHIDTLHFDEAWLPHAAFHDFYGDYHAIGYERPRCARSR
jgi:arginine decarboxylase